MNNAKCFVRGFSFFRGLCVTQFAKHIWMARERQSNPGNAEQWRQRTVKPDRRKTPIKQVSLHSSTIFHQQPAGNEVAQVTSLHILWRKNRQTTLDVAKRCQRRDEGWINPAKRNTQEKSYLSSLSIHSIEPCPK